MGEQCYSVFLWSVCDYLDITLWGRNFILLDLSGLPISVLFYLHNAKGGD